MAIVNDADAAGVAEMRFGAGRGQLGEVFVLTLGTGVGSALFIDGVLVPNTELGHMEIRGRDAERRSAAAARIRRGLSWKAWATDLDEHLIAIDRLFSPSLFILGGGVSKNPDKFIPYLTVRVPVVPAQLRNDAGTSGRRCSRPNAEPPDSAPAGVTGLDHAGRPDRSTRPTAAPRPPRPVAGHGPPLPPSIGVPDERSRDRAGVDTVEVGASARAIWTMLDDPEALARILPGCESIVRETPDRFVAVIASKVRFMTIRSDVVATLLEADRPRHVRLQLDGSASGLGGSFNVSTPVRHRGARTEPLEGRLLRLARPRREPGRGSVAPPLPRP